MDIKKLKEKLKEGTFYYHKFGLFIKGKVNIVLQNSETTLNVSFAGGIVDVYMDRIKLIRRPGNIIEKFEWCYILKNEYNECIGYIGKVEEK